MPLSASLDVLDRLVDDRVVADVDALAVRELPRLALGPDVEADDDRVGGGRQVDVVLGDGTDTAADDPQADLVADVDLEQRVLERLDRTGHVTLEDEVELVDLALLDALEHVLERHAAAAVSELRRHARAPPLLGDLTGDPVLGDDDEVVAGARNRR